MSDGGKADTDRCDVLVIGGGPAGSTAAALLAERGRDVILLEREQHPRFHIGESLLPRNLEILDRLGLRDQVVAMGVLKPGAEFVSDDTGQSVSYPFRHSIAGSNPHSYQVRRSEFDHMLFKAAAARGARTAEATRVTEVADQQDGSTLATAATPEGVRRITARFVVDASGRDGVLAKREGIRVSNKRNNTAAMYAHFDGAEARTGETEGYITVHLTQNGWFWMIPLQGSMSVGFVGNQDAFKHRGGTPVEAFFEEKIRSSPQVSARLRHATRTSEVRSTSNYSYRASRSWGEGWVLAGDAYAFIDPMFSSGVLLAMTAGEMASETAHAWLDDPGRGRALAERAERRLNAGMDRLSWLITRINDPTLREMFMSPGNKFRMRDGVISLLAGHLEAEPGTRFPVAAFKATYHALRLTRKLRGVDGPAVPAPELVAAE